MDLAIDYDINFKEIRKAELHLHLGGSSLADEGIDYAFLSEQEKELIKK